MAERTVAVRLVGITQAYEAAMAKAGAATRTFATGSMGALDKNSEKLRSMGRNASLFVTAPLIALGGAAVKSANDFDQAFSQMVGLAGVAAGEVDGLKQSVLDLAGETTVAPQELAEGLYFASSAGLDTAAAMDAVGLAAKASAAGMGTTKDVVGLVASAMASYGAANISAAEATDILAATIAEGRAEPEELAASLGQILPMAASLGVSFEEVGGATAYLSNIFGDTSKTVTAMSGLFVKLSTQSDQGKQALLDMGTSSEELQAALSEGGLMGALDHLREHGFDKNREAMAALFDDIEGRRGAMALLADESGTLAESMGVVADNAGSLDNAFGSFAESQGFKNKQAMAELQTAMIELGDTLAPLAADFMGFAGSVAEWFSGLSDGGQTAVLALAGIAAAAGPLMSIAGNVTRLGTGLGLLARNAETGALSVTGVGKAFGGVGVALAGVTVATELWNRMLDQSRESAAAIAGDMTAGWQDKWGTSLDRMSKGIGAVTFDLGKMNEELESFKGKGAADEFINKAEITRLEEQIRLGSEWAIEMTAMQGKAAGLAAEIGITGDEALELLWAQKELGLESPTTSGALADLKDKLSPKEFAAAAEAMNLTTAEANVLAGASDKAAGGSDNAAGAIGGMGENAETAAERIDRLTSALSDAYSEITSQLDAQIAWEEALDNLTASLYENGTTLDITTEAGRANAGALKQQGEALVGLMQKRLEDTGSMHEAVAAGEMYVGNLQEQLRQAGYTEDEISFLTAAYGLVPRDVATQVRQDGAEESEGKVRSHREELERTDGKTASTRVDAETQTAWNNLQSIKDQLAGIQSKTVTVTVAQVQGPAPGGVHAMPASAGAMRGLKGIYDGGRNAGERFMEGFSRGMLDAEPTPAEQLAAAIDDAERLLDAAENRLGNVWDRITGRFSREDAEQALREAENELRKALGGSLEQAAVDEARDTVGDRKDDLDAAKKRISDAEDAMRKAESRRALDKAIAARDAINKAFNPEAWRAADRAVEDAKDERRKDIIKARNEETRAVAAQEKALDRLRRAQDAVAKARARGERADNRAVRDAREAREDAAFNLLEQSEWLVRAGRIGEFRGIAKDAGLRKGEINELIHDLKAVNAAQSNLSDTRKGQTVTIDPGSVKALVDGVNSGNIRLDVDVELDGRKVAQAIRIQEKRGQGR